MDAQIEQFGAFGKFQKRSSFIAGLISLVNALILYCTIFTAAKPALICSYSNGTSLNATITKELCKIWQNASALGSNVTYECHFDKTFYGRTLVSDWELICDRAYLAEIPETAFMVGGFSVIFSGYFGDVYGRKKCVLVQLLGVTLSMLLNDLFVSEFVFTEVYLRYIFYCIFQFLKGLFSFALYSTTYILLLETTTHEYHTRISNIYLNFFVFGELVILLVAYFLRDWHWIGFTMSIICVLVTLIASFGLHESPRWLVTQSRFEEANKILKIMARMNGKSLRVVEIGDERSPLISSSVNTSETDATHTKSDKSDEKKNLFKTLCKRKFLVKTILNSIIWISINFLYFGVSLGVTSIDFINPYLIYLFSSIFELIGYSLCAFNHKFGHRYSNTFYFLIAGLTTFSLGFVSNGSQTILVKTVIIALTSIGKCVVSASFNTCFVFSSEQYPTSIRNFSILFLSGIGCLGSILSSQMNVISEIVWKPLPNIIFGICAIASMICSLALKDENTDDDDDDDEQ